LESSTSSDGPVSVYCPCGNQLTAWDVERRVTECVRCYLIRMGAIPSMRTAEDVR
jgi:hypothetical protein